MEKSLRLNPATRRPQRAKWEVLCDHAEVSEDQFECGEWGVIPGHRDQG